MLLENIEEIDISLFIILKKLNLDGRKLMDIKQIVLDLCALSDEQEWFEFQLFLQQIQQQKKTFCTVKTFNWLGE